ncbi:MAG: serine O-acetyltransferase [Alphaproteobacteria bacterium]|nr:serine O-acetyltransferase [Alphaproteobacteria bacterium]MBU0796703.1 serine O-acetyltransferase [Alphaproteobacteria bacterium]MBU0888252.1 serine O-acetyltransferase [Alphaproteobacteria bacterium]MBU1811453.1 serine O-acetyltransferase [Alphaproteobacteria bacterium]MBU2090463.1 serine O-acetyltransferase [Alphaproteobacteria bacterium]
MFKKLGEDIAAIMARDPAAKSRIEVVLCYPGFHALLLHRLANAAWRRQWYLLGRFLSHVGRVLTGIEIHPGATIGRRFFVDHGMGVVIGETAQVGDDVTLYQGVTLGGTSLHQGKRHPTLEDGVIVGSGAQVLGPLTVGRGARVGANAVVLKDVAPGVTVVGIPAQVAISRAKQQDSDFCAYGTSVDMPDPVARALDGLLGEVAALKTRLAELEGAHTPPPAKNGHTHVASRDGN